MSKPGNKLRIPLPEKEALAGLLKVTPTDRYAEAHAADEGKTETHQETGEISLS